MFFPAQKKDADSAGETEKEKRPAGALLSAYSAAFYLMRPMPQIVNEPLPVIETFSSPVVS